MQHLLQKDSKVFRYGNTVPVAVVWSKDVEEIWYLKKKFTVYCVDGKGGQEHWRWERKGWVGRGANVVDPLYPNMGIHILLTVSLYILFCADKENLFTYQVQCTLLIGNYILCSYWFSSDTVLRNPMQVTPSHVKINDGVDLDASLKQQQKKKSDKREFWTTQYFASNLLILLVQLCGIAVGLLGQVLHCSTISSNPIDSYVCLAVHVHVCCNNLSL